MAKAQYKPRFGHDIRIKPDERAAPKMRRCAIAGCGEEGGYRVPKNRENLSTYLWLCLAHARQHNEKWDYFAGMSEAQIARFQEEAVVGHRPTWPLGKRAAGFPGGHGPHHIEDGHAVFADDLDKPAGPRRPERVLTRLQRQAFDVLNLESSATLKEIKARYKELVKRFHPDANGGDRGAEERLKLVIKAYGVLRASGLT
ncbi:MAG: J domain-containing protein [Alphaproteobacteria bacterium]|nr:J domain-containing protein [Alphaproteobacteria bacterium]